MRLIFDKDAIECQKRVHKEFSSVIPHQVYDFPKFVKQFFERSSAG